MCFVPGAVLSLTICAMLARWFPGFPPLVLPLAGFVAFAIAVGVAADPPRAFGPRQERIESVLGLLELRRNRTRYAFVFAVAAAVFAEIGLRMAGSLGIAIPFDGNALELAVTAGLLFAAAWIQIGRSACSSDAIHRALRRLG